MGILFSTPVKRLHIVLFAYEAWGHARPLCNLAVRLAQSRPIDITFFTTPSFRDRIDKELRRSVVDDDMAILDSIRVVALRHDGAHALDNRVLELSFAEAYEKLVKNESVTCLHTGIRFDPIQSPSAVVVDFYARSLLESVRRLSTKQVKVFAWFAGAASAIFRFCGPEDKGGMGNLRTKSENEAARSEIKLEAAAGEIILSATGSLVEIPGLPPMYDHELEPQEISGGKKVIGSMVGAMMLSAYDVFTSCDGIILATPECYEQTTTSALREWFASSSRSVYACGPMIPHGTHANKLEGEQSTSTAEIDAFMDCTLQSHGERSILYISLGTVYWPSEPEMIWAFLDAVMELNIPFIFSHATSRATIPDSIAQRVKEYGHGVITSWSPQQLILEHPATGWFVTHGGHNSVIEAICAGIPMICWPFSFDQPLNAAYLTHELEVAYELFEIRDGPGLGPVRRTGKTPTGTVKALRAEATNVLKDAFGEDGDRKRANIIRIKQNATGAWSKKGTSSHAIESFLNSISC